MSEVKKRERKAPINGWKISWSKDSRGHHFQGLPGRLREGPGSVSQMPCQPQGQDVRGWFVKGLHLGHWGVGSRDLEDQKVRMAHRAKEENPPRQLLVGFQLSAGIKSKRESLLERRKSTGVSPQGMP